MCAGAFGQGTLWETANQRGWDLVIGSYATSHTVSELAKDEALREKAIETIRRMGITTLYLEIYRSGHVVPTDELIAVRDWLLANGVSVIGGIATTPGGDVGVEQNEGLTWYNWQNPKTQRDLAKVMRDAAPVFDAIIVDDFYCTGDTSAESEAARGGRDWGTYRRDLLTRLAQDIFIGPAKEVNPGITVIIKYPQWYDRFHLFGYDTETFPVVFDSVYVGTETRGALTQRFGFTPATMGFNNFRWLAGISGEKIGGAWFDHGDCGEYDFLDQAYTSVLAGARELVYFNFNDMMNGHPDHARVVDAMDTLFALAATVRRDPVEGVMGYKPVNSAPGGDMFLMDFVGMLGVPLIPTHEYPGDASAIFLPTQATADPNVFAYLKASLSKGATVTVTTGFLASVAEGNEAAALAGVAPVTLEAMQGAVIGADGSTVATAHGLDLAARLETAGAETVVSAKVGDATIPFLTTHGALNGTLAVLNTRTFDQADYDRVGEVLLAPRMLGINELPRETANAIRAVMNQGAGFTLDAPSRVSVHPLGDGTVVIQNFTNEDTPVKLKRGVVEFDGVVPARGRVWAD